MTISQPSSTPAPGAPGPHPVSGCLESIGAALDDAAEAPVWSMTSGEQRAALVEAAALEARLTGLRLRVLAGADANRVGDASGASSTPAWVAHHTRQRRAAAHADLRLAAALDTGAHQPTRDALDAGAVNVEQAKVVLDAVDTLAEDVPAAAKQEAEEWLIEQATHRDATELRVLGRRIFEVIDPERADEEEGKRLADEEARARQKASLSIHANGDGTSSGRFKLPDLHAAMLSKALQALTAPRRIGDARIDPDTGKKMPYPTLLGHGLMELIEHLPVDRLPSNGGTAATIVITLSLQKLLSGIGAASLDTGGKISAGEARRLACNAGIIPLVLDGDSMPLDIGREQRLHTRYQRIAMSHRDRGCVAENCDRPPAWTEAHHKTLWSQGGRTTLDDGELACPHHHRLLHHPEYRHARLPNGQIRFHRRQ